MAEAAIYRLYDQMRTMIFDFVHKNMGTKTEGQDVLQEAIVIVYEQIRNGKYVHTGKLSTYVYSVARYIWLNKLKRKKTEARIMDSQPFIDVQESPLTQILDNEQAHQIKAVFELMGLACRQLLTYIIYDDMSMKDVSERMHYENEQVVRNKKYKCIKQLKEILSTRPDLVSLLKSAYDG